MMAARLKRLCSLSRQVAFDSLFDDEPCRSEIVGLFMAMLELLKLGETHIEQEGIYGEIVLYPGRREDTPEENE